MTRREVRSWRRSSSGLSGCSIATGSEAAILRSSLEVNTECVTHLAVTEDDLSGELPREIVDVVEQVHGRCTLHDQGVRLTVHDDVVRLTTSRLVQVGGDRHVQPVDVAQNATL